MALGRFEGRKDLSGAAVTTSSLELLQTNTLSLHVTLHSADPRQANPYSGSITGC